MQGENCIQVCIRVRPIAIRRKEEVAKSGLEVLQCTSAQTLRLTPPLNGEDGLPVHAGQIVDYNFDSVLPGSTTQTMVYDRIGERLVQGVTNGFHGCAFAYGQTCSGKSHTIFGGVGKDRGLVSRIGEGLFTLLGQQAEEHIVKISYLELYNEKARDLLSPSAEPCGGSLDIREHPKVGVFVKGLSRNVVKGPEDVARLLDFGHKIRVVGCTNMNAMSSRSHAVVTLYVESLVGAGRGELGVKRRNRRRAQVHAVDLAGSESLRSVGESELRRQESKQINKSLLALSQMISRLVDKEQAVRRGAPGAPHIPYRNSKLTYLLSEALMGNCRTTMLACVSPLASSFWTTESTLRFASSVKKLHTRPVRNEEAEGDLVKSLQSEIESLRQQLTEAKHSVHSKKDLQDKLTFDLYLENEFSTTWDESQAITRNADNERRRTLVRLGLSSAKPPPAAAPAASPPAAEPRGETAGAPYLVNVCEDALLSGCLTYSLPLGQTVWVGSDPSCSIKVDGLGVQPHMCSLVCVDASTVEVRVADMFPTLPKAWAAPPRAEGRRKGTVTFASEGDKDAGAAEEQEEDTDGLPRRKSTMRRGVARQFGSLFKRSVVEVFVNGHKVHRRRELEDGDHMRIGSTHAFKVSIPRLRDGPKLPGIGECGVAEVVSASVWSKDYSEHVKEYVGPERAARALKDLEDLRALVEEANDITDELRGGEGQELTFKLHLLSDMVDADEDPVAVVALHRAERPVDVTEAGPQFEAAATRLLPAAVWTGAQFQHRLDALRDLYQEVSSREAPWGAEPQDLDPWKDEKRVPVVGARQSVPGRGQAAGPGTAGANALGLSQLQQAAGEPEADFELQREELQLLQRRVPEMAAELLQARAELAEKEEQLKQLPILERRVAELREAVARTMPDLSSGPPDRERATSQACDPLVQSRDRLPSSSCYQPVSSRNSMGGQAGSSHVAQPAVDVAGQASRREALPRRQSAPPRGSVVVTRSYSRPSKPQAMQKMQPSGSDSSSNYEAPWIQGQLRNQPCAAAVQARQDALSPRAAHGPASRSCSPQASHVAAATAQASVASPPAPVPCQHAGAPGSLTVPVLAPAPCQLAGAPGSLTAPVLAPALQSRHPSPCAPTTPGRGRGQDPQVQPMASSTSAPQQVLMVPGSRVSPVLSGQHLAAGPMAAHSWSGVQTPRPAPTPRRPATAGQVVGQPPGTVQVSFSGSQAPYRPGGNSPSPPCPLRAASQSPRPHGHHGPCLGAFGAAGAGSYVSAGVAAAGAWGGQPCARGAGALGGRARDRFPAVLAPPGSEGADRWQHVQGEVARLRRELDALNELCHERR